MCHMYNMRRSHLGEMVGNACDLKGDSEMLRDLAVQPALSPTLVPDRVLVFGKAVRRRLWDVLPGLCLGLKLLQL